jgi:hypothetical protein
VVENEAVQAKLEKEKVEEEFSKMKKLNMDNFNRASSLELELVKSRQKIIELNNDLKMKTEIKPKVEPPVTSNPTNTKNHKMLPVDKFTNFFDNLFSTTPRKDKK